MELGCDRGNEPTLNTLVPSALRTQGGPRATGVPDSVPVRIALVGEMESGRKSAGNGQVRRWKSRGGDREAATGTQCEVRVPGASHRARTPSQAGGPQPPRTCTLPREERCGQTMPREWER